jgi:ABC-type multidrug transport system fused ATPase/permease subunit
VRDNLTFFDCSIPDTRILETINNLGLERWFAGLPAGLDTVLASGAAGLSAGEAQLLAFTRIFLKDPGIVILDEASSRLDPATEHLIERAIDQLVAGRTVIIIAHRLKTIERADEILILENGRILEHGPQEQLRADRHSHFAALLQTGMQEVLA